MRLGFRVGATGYPDAMATWEYGELMAESVTMSDNGQWTTKIAVTWHGPDGTRAVTGTGVFGLNRLGAAGWELVGVTRNQIEDKFQIKVMATYVLRRPVHRRTRRGEMLPAGPATA